MNAKKQNAPVWADALRFYQSSYERIKNELNAIACADLQVSSIPLPTKQLDTNWSLFCLNQQMNKRKTKEKEY